MDHVNYLFGNWSGIQPSHTIPNCLMSSCIPEDSFNPSKITQILQVPLGNFQMWTQAGIWTWATKWNGEHNEEGWPKSPWHSVQETIWDQLCSRVSHTTQSKYIYIYFKCNPRTQKTAQSPLLAKITGLQTTASYFWGFADTWCSQKDAVTSCKSLPWGLRWGGSSLGSDRHVFGS